MKTEQVKLTKLKVNSENPRTITKDKFDKLINSILVFPRMLEIRPIVVDGDYTALGGNQRTEALKAIAKMEITTIADRLTEVADFQRMSKAEQEDLIRYWDAWLLGDKKVSVIKADELTEDERKQFIIKDNAGFGDWDWDMLANSWDADLLTDWGLDLPTDWDTTEEETREASEDDFTEEDAANAETRVKAGEIWQLGEHRLMCGDSTKKEDVERLMNGEKADMVFTDPPYGVDIVQNSHVGGEKIAKVNTYIPIKGDETTETARLNYEILKDVSKEQIIFGGNYFTDFLPPKACWVIWDKQNTGNFADVEMAWTSMNKGAKLYQWLWNGLCRKGDREIEGKTRVHPTQKPVGLIADILNDFTKEGEIILDCFGGSGSTLIACEQINRKCRMIEYESYYCDVIIARWEKLTGKEAVKIYG